MVLGVAEVLHGGRGGALRHRGGDPHRTGGHALRLPRRHIAGPAADPGQHLHPDARSTCRRRRTPQPDGWAVVPRRSPAITESFAVQDRQRSAGAARRLRAGDRRRRRRRSSSSPTTRSRSCSTTCRWSSSTRRTGAPSPPCSAAPTASPSPATRSRTSTRCRRPSPRRSSRRSRTLVRERRATAASRGRYHVEGHGCSRCRCPSAPRWPTPSTSRRSPCRPDRRASRSCRCSAGTSAPGGSPRSRRWSARSRRGRSSTGC